MPATTWTDLEDIFNERNQAQNGTTYMIILYEVSTIGKSREI